MFRRQKCGKCGKKIRDSYSFCPHCGNRMSGDDWGMLGKNDFMIPNEVNNAGLPAGFNSIFNFLMKNIEQQFSQANRNSQNPNEKKGISISISGSGGNQPRINVSPFGEPMKEKKERIKEMPSKKLSDENLKKFQSLERKEPKAEMRRFADRIVYEISLPGVESANDVSITRMENSIELRAVAKKKAYFKLIPISLPILNYTLSEGKLILELKSE